MCYNCIMKELFVALRRKAQTDPYDIPSWESLGYYDSLVEAQDSIVDLPAGSSAGDILTAISVDHISDIHNKARELKIVSNALVVHDVQFSYRSNTWFQAWDGDEAYLSTMVRTSISSQVKFSKIMNGMTDVLEACNRVGDKRVKMTISMLREYCESGLYDKAEFDDLIRDGVLKNDQLRSSAHAVLWGSICNNLYTEDTINHPFTNASVSMCYLLGKGDYVVGSREAGAIFSRSVTLTDILMANIDWESE